MVVKEKVIPQKDYIELRKDMDKILKINSQLCQVIKENNLTYNPQEEYIETYKYHLHDNMRELKPLVADAIEMSPHHIKQKEMNSNAVMSLPEATISKQRGMASAQKQAETASSTESVS